MKINYLKVLLLVLALFVVKMTSAQMDTKMPYATNYGYVGLANTNTVLSNGSKFTGIGPIAGVRFSGLALISDDGNHRFYFTDMTSLDIGFGGRVLNDAALATHPLIDSTGPYFFFSFYFGFQTFYRITEKIDLGGQIFYNANYDDARSPASASGSGNDDNLMFGIHARFDRFVLELNEKVPNKVKDYQEFQHAQFAKLIYIFDKEKRRSIALSYDYFKNGYTNLEDMKSSNIRLVLVLPIF